MNQQFFPNSVFAWCFLAALGIALGVASYIDWRRMVIPKWITLGLLGGGLLVNVVRGAFLASEGYPLWIFETGDPLLGALDGLTFALVGFVTGFAMLFIPWILGTCGVGDVKLFAGLGAWLGPFHLIFVLFGSLIVLMVEVVFKILTAGLTPTGFRKLVDKPRPIEGGTPSRRTKRRVMSYSFPVAVATLAVLLWAYRVELRLAEPRPENSTEVPAHVTQ